MQKLGMNTSIIEKANSYINTLGFMPGIANLLLCRSDLDSLDISIPHTLSFGLYINGQNINITIPTLYITKANCLTPGQDNDPNSLYLVEAVDRRWLAKRLPIEKQYNVKNPNTQEYFKPTSNNGQPFTWEQVIGNVWTINGKLGDFPGLPYTPNSIPENYQFIGIDSYDALNILLAKISCTLQYDAINDTFNIIRLGEIDSQLEARFAALRNNLLLDRDPIENLRTKVTDYVRVYFHKQSKHYGQETSTTDDDQWITQSWYTVDIKNTYTDNVEPNSKQIFWDDLHAIVEDGGVINFKELEDRAKEVADNYFLTTIFSTKRLLKKYSGPITVFTPSSQIRSVMWCIDSNGITTEISTYPEEVASNISYVDFYNKLSESENLRAPDFNQETYPVYFPQMQLLALDGSYSSVNGGTFYNATIQSLNPDTLVYENRGACYAYKEPNDGQSTAGFYFGKILGTYTIDNKLLPLYEIIQPSFPNTFDNLTTHSLSVLDGPVDFFRGIYTMKPRDLVAYKKDPGKYDQGYQIYVGAPFYVYGPGVYGYQIPISICGYMFWCQKDITLNSYTYNNLILDDTLPGEIVYFLKPVNNDVDIGGIVPANDVFDSDGQVIALVNLGPNFITLKHLSDASTARFRINCPGQVDYILAPGGSVLMYHDQVRLYWNMTIGQPCMRVTNSSSATALVLNNITKQVFLGAFVTQSGKDTALINVFGGLTAGNLNPLFTTTVTPNANPILSFSQISQSPNLFYLTPQAGAGNPTFRGPIPLDLTANNLNLTAIQLLGHDASGNLRWYDTASC